MSLAPIVLFAYKRPEHTKLTLDALGKNTLAAESDLIVYIDGLKPGASPLDVELHKKVIALANTFKGCRSTTVIESPTNKGLANSVIEGVTKVVNEHGKIIVLEDDLMTSPLFLEYMNQALDKYESSPEVACISGYVYPLKKDLKEAFFLKGADCWGWATWDEKWKLFRNEPEELYNELTISGLKDEFDFTGSYPYMNMLKDRHENKNQSWAILWYASAFLKNKFCLYPPQSLVLNTGNDGSGTHNTDSTKKFDGDLGIKILPVLPTEIKESTEGKKAFEDFFVSLKNEPELSLLQRIKNKVRSAIK